MRIIIPTNNRRFHNLILIVYVERTNSVHNSQLSLDEFIDRVFPKQLLNKQHRVTAY